MARCILMTGGGGGVMSEDTTVAAEDVLEGKTYLGSDTDDEIGVGTMPNNDSFSSTLNCGQSILIPKGYHTGSGKITANSLASQTPGNATAASMLNGRIAWVDGKKITGTIPSQGAATFSPSKGTTKTIITSGKYTSGDIKLAGFNMPDPSKLAKGYTYTLYGQSVTGTVETVPTPQKRYLVKNGVIQEGGGSWILKSQNGNSPGFSVGDGVLKLDSGYGTSHDAYVQVISSVPIMPLYTNSIEKYRHIYVDYYIQSGPTKYSTSFTVYVCSSKTGNDPIELVHAWWYVDSSVKQKWLVASTTNFQSPALDNNSYQYPYLMIAAHDNGNGASLNVWIKNIYFDMA